MDDMSKPFRGFTLVELVIVVTILAVLSAVAIPTFQNLQQQAKDNAVKGAVGALRAAISQYRMAEIANGRQPGTPGSWPTNGCPSSEIMNINQFPAGPWAMENGITPKNPWAVGVKPAGQEDWIGVITAGNPPRGEISAPLLTGWRYNRTTCEVWANTAENGGPVTENEF